MQKEVKRKRFKWDNFISKTFFYNFIYSWGQVTIYPHILKEINERKLYIGIKLLLLCQQKWNEETKLYHFLYTYTWTKIAQLTFTQVLPFRIYTFLTTILIHMTKCLLKQKGMSRRLQHTIVLFLGVRVLTIQEKWLTVLWRMERMT